MILTVSLNAALDVTYTVDDLQPHTTHRVRTVRTRAGGKGVNVSRVLHALGHSTVVTGLTGGDTGRAIRAELAESDLPSALVEIAAESRRTVAVVSGGDATLFNEPGPEVTEAEWASFREHFAGLAPTASVVVLSGSLPPGLPTTAYRELLEIVDGRAPTVLDADGDALRHGLGGNPTAIKPNAAELRAVTGIADPATAARALVAGGAEAVLASGGPAGLLAITDEGSWRARPPRRLAGNPTGAGDACVAALAAGLAHGREWPRILREAAALSAAAVLHPQAGSFDAGAYERFLPTVMVEIA
ncbi:1-phosphofructokinase family hexose kinase [Crossiella sp. SN42]|uniref:1-phosphofructokinase family hexose kinase n=1 Tax=Crossiella sp. SN42 TaxID=2944808 RepID=UPI00207D144B|nr:1-phosphofructokinase family hexose kinase [Crossiella sp. SN42]MCO1578561.1 1-phosphofructokinase family hexose kinase [Crossiella sp. SN42]